MKTLLAKQRDYDWEPVTIWRPRRINKRWYWPGAKLYRYFALSPGGGFWIYGDEFSVLKN